jgi:uncharacterized protein YggE
MKLSKYLILLVGMIGIARAEVTPDRPFIHSIGTASVRVRPEVLHLRFAVEAKDVSNERALEISEQRALAVLKILREFPIPEADILSVNVSARREWRDRNAREGEQEPSYFVTRRFEIILRQIPTARDLVAQLSAAGISEMGELLGMVEDTEAIKNDLKVKALAEARKRAEIMATSMGMIVDGVHAVSEVGFDELEREFLRNGRPDEREFFVQGINRPPEPQTFYFRDIELSAVVHVVFLLAEKK